MNRENADSRSVMPDRLELMRRLEASLCRSHQALAALDLAGIRHETEDQWSLCGSLRLEIRRMKAARDRRVDSDSETSGELRQRAWKVLAAVRLQAALLKRAQRKLVVIANMLAGAERNYGSAEVRSQGAPFASHTEKQG